MKNKATLKERYRAGKKKVEIRSKNWYKPIIKIIETPESFANSDALAKIHNRKK